MSRYHAREGHTTRHKILGHSADNQIRFGFARGSSVTQQHPRAEYLLRSAALPPSPRIESPRAVKRAAETVLLDIPSEPANPQRIRYGESLRENGCYPPRSNCIAHFSFSF